jgi:5-methylcytosine-specific restriction protein A
MSNREFRKAESYIAEGITRAMVSEFLRERGFRDVQDHWRFYGRNQSQAIAATAPSGERLVMRVRLCWHRAERKLRGNNYSASQVMSSIRDNDWEGTLREKVESERSEGITHFLIVQREAESIIYAAMFPISELLPIWRAQHETSLALIAKGKLGRRRTSHAKNGSSPTLWLQDDRAPEVARALWDHKGVQDLASLQRSEVVAEIFDQEDDTFDDMPNQYSQLGSDGSPRVPTLRSGVRRDPRVRAVVLKRARGMCEREGCGISRDYTGFLDVHHILGAERGDRVWNCVAVCPNCHREAHAAPYRERINAELWLIAERSRHEPELRY